MSATPALRRRPVDIGLIAFFAVSVAYGLLFSLPEGLGVPVSADSPWPPLRALYAWAIAQEPAHLAPPPGLIASCLFDSLFQAPLLIALIDGLARARDWVRAPALFYAGAAVTNMFFYFFTTFAGPTPPPHPVVYLPYNLPWLFAPMLLAWRMRSPAPFAPR